MAQMMRRLMQSVTCAAVHSATQRVSTWLLHADDRVTGQSFDITQRTLADIFSLRPATVSDACNKLLSVGAIHYSRGTLSVLDRQLLEAQACECYDAVCLHRLEASGL
jgi:CRP-like cAMP-binding protein